jgi:hypothetical protein
LREALAAADHDYILTDSLKPRQRSKRARTPQAKGRRDGLSPMRTRRLLRFAVGALFVAALGGIAFNALTLQKKRHPAPLFGHTPPAFAAKEPAVAEPDAAPPAVPAVPRLQQAASSREQDGASAKPVTDDKAASAHSHSMAVEAPDAAPRDAISQLLLGKSHESEVSQLAAASAASAASATTVRAAQKALVKLGFVLKADGLMGATTRQAIERFERDHGRAITGELTPAVLRRLAADSGIPIH